jgi:hypothetical protein
LQVLTHWLAITNFFPMNGISEVVDLSRHDWKHLDFQLSPLSSTFLKNAYQYTATQNFTFLAQYPTPGSVLKSWLQDQGSGQTDKIDCSTLYLNNIIRCFLFWRTVDFGPAHPLPWLTNESCPFFGTYPRPFSGTTGPFPSGLPPR